MLGEAEATAFFFDLLFVVVIARVITPINNYPVGFFFLDLDLFGDLAKGVLDDGELFVVVVGGEPFAHDGFELADALGVVFEVGWFGAKAGGDLVDEVVVFGATGAVDAGVRVRWFKTTSVIFSTSIYGVNVTVRL
jgi:hypothetical protein